MRIILTTKFVLENTPKHIRTLSASSPGTLRPLEARSATPTMRERKYFKATILLLCMKLSIKSRPLAQK